MAQLTFNPRNNMAKEIIPLVINDFGNYNVNTDEDVTIMYHNMSPIQTGAPSEWSLGVRPALGTATTTFSIDDNTRGRGIADFQGYDLMAVNDDTWYYSGGSTEIHTTSPFDKEALAKFTLYSQAGADRLVLVNAGAISTAGTSDGSIWFMTNTTSAPTEVTDADAPGQNGNSLCRGGVSLDGFFFVGDILGNINNCVLDDLTTWVSTGLVVAEREADIGIYCGRHRDHLFMLGTRSLEFFYNNANAAPASPLLRRNDVFFTTGCFHPNSVLEFGNSTFFIGKSDTGDVGLYELKNFLLEKIGLNPVMDKMIKSLKFFEPVISGATDLQQDVYLAAFNSSVNGQFLVLTLPVFGSFALHLPTQTWARWYIGGTPPNNGGISDWTSPKIFPLTASLNRSGANLAEPNRFMLLNGIVSAENTPTSDVVYTSNSFDASTQIDATPEDAIDIIIANNGTAMFISDNEKCIFQYTLSTAFDVSTATYDSKSFEFTVVSSGVGMIIAMSPDGVKLLVSTGTTVFQYTLGTAYDITTATSDSKTLSIGGGTLTGAGYNNDGTRFYEVTGLGIVKQYDVSTAYDIDTAVDSTKSFDLTGDISGEVNGFAMGVDDSTFHVGDGVADLLREFVMTDAADVSTAVASGTTLDYSNEASTMANWWITDGKTYGVQFSPATIYQYGVENTLIPTEFQAGQSGITNPDFTVYTKPWDLDTNERKRINNIRLLHYPDPRLSVGTSNIGIDWIDTEDVTEDGISPASFTSDRNIDINSMTARLYRAGICRQRIYKLTFTGTRTQILKGLEIDFDQLRG